MVRWHVALVGAGVAGGALLLIPSVLAPYPLYVLCQMLVFAIACMGFNLIFGTAGMPSFGHATYFGVAAYTGAFLHNFLSVQSFELYLLSGIVSSATFAAIIGYLCVRTTKIFFSILTLAFSMIVYSLVINGAVFRLLGETGRRLYELGGGSMYIPRLSLVGTEFQPAEFIPVFYNVIVVAFVVTVLILWRISRSPFGLAFRAIRDNETRAAFVGIPVRAYRWHAFILSGTVLGLAGGLYGQLARQITPDQLYWLFSAHLVLATVLGGSRYFLGPVFGAFLFIALNELASRWTVGRSMTLGALLILVVLAFPAGFAGGLVALKNAVMKRLG